MTNETNVQGDALRDRWYFVSASGIVTLCANERDARDAAAEADRDWPHHAPHIPMQLAALASSPAPVGGAVHLGIRFGHGAVGVSTGAYDGDAAVFLREAVVPGTVGAAFSDDEREAMPLRAVLLFPTAAQAKAVADALVTPAPPERHEAQGAES